MIGTADTEGLRPVAQPVGQGALHRALAERVPLHGVGDDASHELTSAPLADPSPSARPPIRRPPGAKRRGRPDRDGSGDKPTNGTLPRPAG